MILDDAVVHDGDSVSGDMRMRVAHRGDPVRGPARVGDADVTFDRVGIEDVLQRLHFAHGTHAHQPVLGRQYGKTGGIVAPVFETAQSLHQDGNGVALRDNTHDSTHIELLRGVNMKYEPLAWLRATAF